MPTELYDALLIESLCLDVVGKHASACDWRDLIRVRDHVDRLLNRAINDRQLSPGVNVTANGGVATRRPRNEGSERVTSFAPRPACADLPGRHSSAMAAGQHPHDPQRVRST